MAAGIKKTVQAAILAFLKKIFPQNLRLSNTKRMQKEN
jgi:hypothetical protein